VRTISTDPFRRVGFSNDPAETDTFVAWLRLPWVEFYLTPAKLQMYRSNH
jgi:hypothetical protein